MSLCCFSALWVLTVLTTSTFLASALWCFSSLWCLSAFSALTSRGQSHSHWYWPQWPQQFWLRAKLDMEKSEEPDELSSSHDESLRLHSGTLDGTVEPLSVQLELWLYSFI